MKRLLSLIVVLTLGVSSSLFAQNDDIWRAFASANLPLAMELIEKHREVLDPLYSPPGETETILGFLQRYDLIRDPRAPIPEDLNDDFVEAITGERPMDWRVLVEDETTEQQKELIRRFCGRRSVWGRNEGAFLIHAREEQVLDLAENCMWVQFVNGM